MSFLKTLNYRLDAMEKRPLYLILLTLWIELQALSVACGNYLYYYGYYIPILTSNYGS